ncbi:hypothetical protein WJX73_009086 [Symbiochloris irregularis]|uniref:Uncharacterized protein n=1 Tax=Symbiochloris irregularis TaxID=706552 RepID=A0AAW1P3U9_9CHLO
MPARSPGLYVSYAKPCHTCRSCIGNPTSFLARRNHLGRHNKSEVAGGLALSCSRPRLTSRVSSGVTQANTASFDPDEYSAGNGFLRPWKRCCLYQ